MTEKDSKMLIKNVVANWLFIKNPDDNGNYRIEFEVDDKQEKEIMDVLKECAENAKVKFSECDWKGSFKEHENGVHSFGAKCSSEFVNKKGETIKRELDVYNINAQKLTHDEIPIVANGATINLVVEPYYCEYKRKKGVMLGLRSVQLLQYKEYTQENPYVDESGDCPFDSDKEQKDIFD